MQDPYNPIDAKTLAETTTCYDVPVASTAWLVARGQIDPDDVPIAGYDNVPVCRWPTG